ncbi:MAG: DNA primase [Trichloromonadaceae bacterium]
MSSRIADDKINEIRERVDIVDVVSSYLPLKRSGANHSGLCPFHAEKTPSFNVNGPRQIFHCFGCGVGGNVFSFLMRMEGLSFPEAVRRMGERVGIEVAEESLSPAEERRREELEQLGRINAVAAEFYHKILLDDPEGATGRRYLRERGYDGEIARQFQLGFAPARWDALTRHLSEKGFAAEQVRDTLGLIRAGNEGREYDLFRNRLLFPIHDLNGRVAAFGGRVLDDALPKYINSPESPLYHKGRLLFGLYQAREAMRHRGEGIVVEGYFDQLALVRAGFGQAVATCGTALTAEHARLLKRYCGRLLLLFDQDSAGLKATFRAMDVLLAEGIPAAVISLDAGEDPDSFLRKQGAEVFRERLTQARPVLDLFMERTLAAAQGDIAATARGVEEILARLRLLPSDIERSLQLQRLAERTGLDAALLGAKLPGARSAQAPPTSFAPPRPQLAPPRPRKAGGAGTKAQEWLLRLLLAEPTVRQRVAEEGAASLFIDADYLALAERILQQGGEGELAAEKLLDESLSDEQTALLSGILMKDEALFTEVQESVFIGCRQAVTREQERRRSKELQQLIKAAEEQGDLEQLTKYQRELTQISRKR